MKSSFRTTTFAVGLVTGIMCSLPSASAQSQSMNGQWIAPDNSILVIRGTQWFHPTGGTATIKRGKGSSSIEVFYNQRQGTRCAYRVHFAAEGDVLVLEATDQLQALELCPTGRFSRAS
jgi:hypothetical protein